MKISNEKKKTNLDPLCLQSWGCSSSASLPKNLGRNEVPEDTF